MFCPQPSRDSALPKEEEPATDPANPILQPGAGGNSSASTNEQGANEKDEKKPTETRQRANSRAERDRSSSVGGASLNKGATSGMQSGDGGHDRDEGFQRSEMDQMEETLDSVQGHLGEVAATSTRSRCSS